MRKGFHSVKEDGDLNEVARVWLDAARGLRLENKPVTAESLLHRLAVGKKPLAHEIEARKERAENLVLEIEADLRNSGLEPRRAHDLGKQIAQRFRALLPRDSE